MIQTYLDMLRERSAIDFADMIPYTIKLFNEHPEILNEYQQHFQFIFCDEFQGTLMIYIRIFKKNII